MSTFRFRSAVTVRPAIRIRAALTALVVSALVGALLAVSPLGNLTPAQASDGATLTGTVIGAGKGGAAAAPLKDVGIWIADENSEWASAYTTDAFGNFVIHGLAASSYTILFEHEGFTREYWNNQPTNLTASFEIKDGVTYSGMNVTLARLPKLTATPTPTITGITTVGQTLTAHEGRWEPAHVNIGFQWYADGEYLFGAFNSTYTLRTRDVGKIITVRVEGDKSGYEAGYATSAPTTPVAWPALSATPTPTITGTAKVGGTLTAKPGAWSPATVTFNYQWLRAGKAISGATASTYKPVKADAGAKLAVAVTGSKSGFASASKSSAATALVTGGALAAAPAPKIAGTAKVGQTLSAKAGVWSPGTVTLKYQWARAGKPITTATKSTYKLVAADVGKTLTVTVTGTRPGYTTVTKTSTASAKVVK